MNKLPSTLRLATAVVMLACLAGLVIVAPSAQAQQSQAAEAELETRLRAELQQQIRAELQQQVEAELRQRLRAELAQQAQAELQHRMQAEMRQIQELNERLTEQVRLAERGAVAEVRNAEEAMRRQQEAMARVEQELRQRGMGMRTLRIRGNCDVYGETVLDFAEELELTDAQVGLIREAQRATRRAAIERNADIEVGEMDLEALYEVDTPDLAAIRAQLEELAMLGVDQQMAGLDLRRQVRDILSEAQLEQLEDMRSTDSVRIVVSGVGSSWRLGNIGC